jgi:hypothetical protein
MADPLDLVIMVKEKHRAELDQLAKSLESHGLHVQQMLPRFRSIIGTADSSAVEKLKSVDGVEMVRPQDKYQLPPMDEKIPQ